MCNHPKRKLGDFSALGGLHKLKAYSSSFWKGALCSSQFLPWLLQTAMRVRQYGVFVGRNKDSKSRVNMPNKLLISIP